MGEVILWISLLVIAYLIYKKSNNSTSDQEIEVVEKQVNRLVQIVNESLQIASDSKNIDTRKSRLKVAKEKLRKVQDIEQKYSFIKIENLSEIRLRIAKIENDIISNKYNKLASINTNGLKLEKEYKIDEAIKAYEKGVEINTDTPATYRRLAILYRKRNDKENEVRVIKKAIENIPSSNKKHFQWFKNRLEKIKK